VPEKPLPVPIPLINPNEPEALLADLSVGEGQLVHAGQVLCTLETTKSTQELLAETDGYVVGLRLAQGQSAAAGELLCYLSDTPEWNPPEVSPPTDSDNLAQGTLPLPPGLRITQPALELARQGGLDLSRLPVGPLVTESSVRLMLEQSPVQSGWAAPETAFDPSALVIYGGGGHGKSLIDLVRLLGIYHLAGIIDDGLTRGETILGLPVLGGGEILTELHAAGTGLAINAVGGIGDARVRVKVFQRLAEAGFACPAVVHPTAHVEASASLSPGVQVFAHAYVGSDSRIGYGAIVNTGAIISHDCHLGDYTNISPGAILAGEVQVGAGTLIGMGATINLRVRVGAGARIGNGATVKSDVPERGVVRAGAIWPA
jgi:acetyltransferase EpsM